MKIIDDYCTQAGYCQITCEDGESWWTFNWWLAIDLGYVLLAQHDCFPPLLQDQELTPLLLPSSQIYEQLIPTSALPRIREDPLAVIMEALL